MTSPFPLPWPTVPAHRIRDDAEALEAAHRLADTFRPDAGERDRDRRLPVAEFDAFSASGLGAITVPRAHSGANVSNVTLAEVIAILSAADASLGQLPQNQLAFFRMLTYTQHEPIKRWIFARALSGLPALATIGGGRSPRERGSRCHDRQLPWQDGSIPAGAGEPG